jgi:hypothetical protein
VGEADHQPAAGAGVFEGGVGWMDASVAEITSDLADLTGVTLAMLDSYDDRVLAPATAPLLRQVDNPTNSVGGHNS